MRRRQVAEEIQLLSTSFLDLLCCGLCSVVLLWVLTGSSKKSQSREDYGFIQIGQTGLWHWKQLILKSLNGSTLFECNIGQITAGVHKEFIQNGVRIYIRSGEENGFAGLIMVSTDKKTEDLELLVTFRQCVIEDDVHVIRVLSESSERIIEDAFVFTSPSNLSVALADRTRKENYDRHVRANVSSTNSLTTLRFQIVNGRIRYFKPE